MEFLNQKMNNIIITFDGPAGSGKSTLAKRVAKYLQYIHLDSGAIYRGYTYAVIREIGLKENHLIFKEAFETLNIPPEEFPLKIEFINQEQAIFLGKQNITPFLRTRELTERIRYIADHFSYRNSVNKILKEISKTYSIVVDGRDMGSEVFPEAQYKFYIDASIEERAKRRYLEIHPQNPNITLEEIKKEIARRDEEDKARKMGALRIPEESIIIDTSFLNRNMVFNLIISFINFKF